MTPGMPIAPNVDSPTPESSPKPARDSSLEESNTQTPTQKPSTRKKKQVVLNDSDCLVLMRLCGEHRLDYRLSNITHFWNLIAQLFEANTGNALYIFLLITKLIYIIGKPLKQPQKTVQILCEERSLQLEQYAKESGTTQDDTDLTDAIDEWQKFINDYEAIRNNKESKKLELDSIKKALTAKKDEILLTRSGSKRRFIELDDDESDSIATKSSSRSESVVIQLKDKNWLNKADWIDIMKSSSEAIDSSKARLDALEQKIAAIDQNTLETKVLLQQIMQKLM